MSATTATEINTSLNPAYPGPRRLSSSRRSATPLMLACSQGLVSEVQNLIPKSSIAQRDRTGKTALHYCTDQHNPACLELILKADTTLIDLQDDEGYTALHLAVINGNLPVARFLIQKGADCNKIDKEKHSVIHWATVCGELECLNLLFEVGANAATADIHGAYPLHYAAQMCGSNSEMGNNPRTGLVILSKLLRMGLDPNVQDQDGRQPILWAASAGSSDAILALINAGANVTSEDKDGLNALHCASSRGHVECMETLICLCGAEVDVIDNNGCTPLFYSVTLGHADCTELLLQYGSDPNRQDRKGRTPAHCGASKGQLETLRLLSQHGANVWAKNIKGDVPLHEAVQSGRKDLVKWLLVQRGDLVNLSNHDGRTSLHLAAINANVEMCKVLMDYKAVVNPIMKNRKGLLMTPLDSAVSRGNRSCAKYLQMHGGVPAAKLVEKYGIHGAVGRIFSGKPELAKDLVLSSSSNPASLDSSFDNRSDGVEKRGSNYVVGSQESLGSRIKLKTLQVNKRIMQNEQHAVHVLENLEASKKEEVEQDTIGPENEKLYQEMASRRQSFIVLENNAPANDEGVDDTEITSNNKIEKDERTEESGIKEEQPSSGVQIAVDSPKPNEQEVKVEFSEEKFEDRIYKEEAVLLESKIKLNKEERISVSTERTEKIVEEKDKVNGTESVEKTDETVEEKNKVNGTESVEKTDETVEEKNKVNGTESVEKTDETVEEKNEVNDGKSVEKADEIVEKKELNDGKSVEKADETVLEKEEVSHAKSVEKAKEIGAYENGNDRKTQKSIQKSQSDLEIKKTVEKVSKIQSDDDKVYKSSRSDHGSAIRVLNDDRGSLSVLSNHNGSDASHATGLHKDSGYSDDLEERFHSDAGDVSSSTSTDCNAVRRVRRRKTKSKARPEVQTPKTHESVIIEPPTVENETGVLVLRPNQTGFVKGENILDIKEDVFRNRSKTKLYRRMSEESNDKPKSHTCLDQPAKKPKRITASTVSASTLKNRRRLERKYADNTTQRSSRSMDPPKRNKFDKPKISSRTSRSVETPRTLSNSTDKYPNYLTAKYKPSEPKDAITNMNKSMRKYYQERQVFQKLLDVKRLQIRCGRANEQILVKRLVDEHANNLNMIGVKPYTGQLTLKSFERYLYDVLRDFSNSNNGKAAAIKNGHAKYKSFILMNNNVGEKKKDVSLCSNNTHRCNHALDAYSSYPGDWLLNDDSQKGTILPKLAPSSSKSDHIVSKRQYRLSANKLSNRRTVSSSKSQSGEPVTFEIKHGAEKNIFTLPTDEISNRKKWQVTFTIGMDKNKNNARIKEIADK